METKDQPPVPIGTAIQWPEGRNFVRVYAGNPRYQARFAMALIGFREYLEIQHEQTDTIEAVDVVLRAFSEKYAEFLIDGFEPDSDVGTDTYHMDPRLLSFMPGTETGE